MPQMSPIYWLVMMLYFIFMLMISVTMINFFFNNMSSTKSFLMKEKKFNSFNKSNSSNDWMW